jgi:hypothetical protein
MARATGQPCWRKSQRSIGAGDCVEVGEDESGDVLVRNSKDPAGPVLRFDRATWQAFLADVKGSRFDLPDAGQDDQRPSSGAPTVQ